LPEIRNLEWSKFHLSLVVISEELVKSLQGESARNLARPDDSPVQADAVLIAGPLRLNPRDQRLSIDDQPVVLTGKSLALLHMLMQHPQTLVTKDQLFDAVWPGVTVSESVLTTAVKDVRKALGDDARNPRFVETVHGRGYRFLVPLQQTDQPSIEHPAVQQIAELPPAAAAVAGARPFRARHWIIPAVVTAIMVAVVAWPLIRPEPAVMAQAAHPKSIAVLPFDDFSPNSDQRWFAEGLTEEIQNRLAHTPDLQVTSRTAAATVRKANTGVIEAAKLLGVANILEGSVRRTDARVRVTVELIRVPDGLQIWSQNYDRPDSDIISIQEDIAFEIARALKTVMDPPKLRAMVGVGTRSVDAYEAYLRGISLDQRQLVEGDVAFARAAAESYEQARQLDPNFATAHWKSARTWFGNATRIDSTVFGNKLSEETRLTGYFDRVNAAIATSRDDTEALKYRSGRAVMQLQFKTAQQLMAQYLRARPRDTEAWEAMGDISAYAGDRPAMARAAERIHTLSIEAGNPKSRAITLSVMALQLPDAVARARQQLALRPTNAITQYQAHRAFIWAGKADEARALLDRIEASTMPEDNKLLAQMRQACAEGRTNDAQRLGVKIAKVSDLNSRWQAAQLMGDEAAATALLQPLDRPERLATLMQFMILPTFDAGRFPVLMAALTRNGVVPKQAIAMPFGCRRA
jgi:TolB-like protein/DNA-binding winged helix-turn-helix (wHTH) protein